MMEINGITLTLDPKHWYRNPQHAADECGLLMAWLVSGAVEGAPSLHTYLTDQYEWFMGWHEPVVPKVEDDMFCYPEDPPLYPLLKATNGNETVIVFQHAIVAVLEDGKLTKWARFD